MSAGYALLSELNENPEIYGQLEAHGRGLVQDIATVLCERSIAHQINHVGSMLSVHLCEEPVTDFASAKSGDNDDFKALFHHMLSQVIYLPPSAYESWFLCACLDDSTHNRTIEAFRSFR